MIEKTCVKCCWCDQCAQEYICNYYDPIDQTELDLEDYEVNLRERVNDYQKILAEIGNEYIETLVSIVENIQENIYGAEDND